VVSEHVPDSGEDLLVQSTVVLAIGHHPRHSPLGIAWTGRPRR
jgi:hypothetical protein